MHRRTYEFYEVWSNLGHNDEERQYRGTLESAQKTLAKLAATVDDNQGRLYLVRVQVLDAWKCGE